MKKLGLLFAMLLFIFCATLSVSAAQAEEPLTLYLDYQVNGTDPVPGRLYKFKVIYTTPENETVTEYPESADLSLRRTYTIARGSDFYVEFLPEDMTDYRVGFQPGGDAMQWVSSMLLEDIDYNYGALCAYIVYESEVKHFKLTKTAAGSPSPDIEYQFEVLTHDYNYRYTKKTVSLKVGEMADIEYVIIPGYENAVYIKELPTGYFCQPFYSQNGNVLPTPVTVPDGYGDYSGTSWNTKITDFDALEANPVVICSNMFNFTPFYLPTDVYLKGTKILDGRALAAGEFSFTLYDGTGTELQTVTNRADGSFAFDPLVYSEAGTYSYSVRENTPAKLGIIYDTTEYSFTVTVAPNEESKLVAQISGDSTLQFTNRYCTSKLSVSKTVEGTEADTEKAFLFTVTFDAEGSFPYSGSSSGTLASGDSFSLKHGESILIEGLPIGTTYRVTEDECEGYASEGTGLTGVIEENKTAEASFKNIAMPQTGDAGYLFLWLSIGTLAAVIFAAARKVRRTREG